MMQPPITHNEEAAAVTSCSGFDFVLSTTAPSHAEDSDDAHIFKSYA